MEELIEERSMVEQELRSLAERLEMLIHENARVAQDQTAYLKQENEIRALYVEKQGHLARLDEQIAERESKAFTSSFGGCLLRPEKVNSLLRIRCWNRPK